ncbi:hypothetical protein DES53_1293 [Roseimicrobium gellanilyticum]|uniref:Uncharacterized protein n=1 Tax=Roseimicrobium gellanilyticum TaxID=748857 RepID=A0A366H053_9BACT|nr:hypothetical protein [Roseimicrobium gellanilyticum]RBP35073.1 hypothetical protein DES53_1293 [Roseimicrobium gellanilyticum]
MRGIIRPISEAELRGMMEAAFNPPLLGETLTRERFAKEYWAVHARVQAALLTIGIHDQYGEADFTMNDDGPLARSLGIQLSSKKLWSPKFLGVLQTILSREPEAYRVFVDHTILEEQEFFLLVTADEAVGFSPNPAVFSIFEK